MTQDQWISAMFKLVLSCGAVAILAFVADYTRLAPWWRNSIGRTLVIAELLLVGALIPAALSLFFHFNRLTSHIAAWLDIACFGLITPVMVWRIIVFEHSHRASDREAAREAEAGWARDERSAAGRDDQSASGT